MIKALVFDADGVLINAELFSIQVERDYGISQKLTTPFFKTEFMDCLEGKNDLKEILSPHLKEWGWNTSVEELLEYWFRVEHSIDEQLVNHIQKLRKTGIKCYLATNQEKYRAEYMLEKMGFKNSFDKIFFSSHIGHRKPQIEYFQKVMEQLLEFKKDEILFWDNEEKNVAVAKNFGWHAEVYINYSDFINKLNSYLS